MDQVRTVPIRMASLVAGVVLLLLFTSLQVLPQENRGELDIHITRPGSTEGVPGVTITLQGPYPMNSAELISSLYTPSSKLTPEMRQQVDDLIEAAPLAVSPEAVAAAATRMEAQLLGLPAPQTLPNAARAAAPPQLIGITDASGHFLFSNLAPGRYQVRAQRDGYFGTKAPVNAGISLPTAVAATASVNPSQPAEEVKMSMVRGATVSGRVRDPNGQPLSGAQISAFQVAYQNAGMVLQSLNSKQTDDRGEYRLFWLPPGDYYVGVTPRRGGRGNAQDNFARTFYPGTSDGRNASRLHVTEGGEISGIDIGMRADAGGKVSGHIVTSIVGPNGQPPQASTFYLLPRDPDAFTDIAEINFPNTASNRGNGQFEIRGVVAGSYDLYAWESAPAGTAYMNPEFMSTYEAQGQAIEVMEGATLNADVKLIQ